MDIRKQTIIQEHKNGSYRVLEKEEKDKAIIAYKSRLEKEKQFRQLKKELNDLSKNCTHPACYDEEGYIYHHRHCLYCGHTSLL